MLSTFMKIKRFFNSRISSERPDGELQKCRSKADAEKKFASLPVEVWQKIADKADDSTTVLHLSQTCRHLHAYFQEANKLLQKPSLQTQNYVSQRLVEHIMTSNAPDVFDVRVQWALPRLTTLTVESWASEHTYRPLFEREQAIRRIFSLATALTNVVVQQKDSDYSQCLFQVIFEALPSNIQAISVDDCYGNVDQEVWRSLASKKKLIKMEFSNAYLSNSFNVREHLLTAVDTLIFKGCNKVRTLPLHLLPNLKILSFCNHEADKSWSDKYFKLENILYYGSPSLQKLLLENNGLKQSAITPNAFQGFSSLRMLSLRENRIDSFRVADDFSPQTFQHLTSLSDLDLSNNRFSIENLATFAYLSPSVATLNVGTKYGDYESYTFGGSRGRSLALVHVSTLDLGRVYAETCSYVHDPIAMLPSLKHLKFKIHNSSRIFDFVLQLIQDRRFFPLESLDIGRPFDVGQGQISLIRNFIARSGGTRLIGGIHQVEGEQSFILPGFVYSDLL